MKILVLYDEEIKGWLVGEALETVPAHIENGYPELKAGYEAGTVKAVVIDVPDEEKYKPELYKVVNGEVTKL